MAKQLSEAHKMLLGANIDEQVSAEGDANVNVQVSAELRQELAEREAALNKLAQEKKALSMDLDRLLVRN